MAESNVSHANQNVENHRWVYFDSTDTIEEGYVLCFDQDATEDGTDPADRLGTTVEKPATANLGMFAGFYTGLQGSFVGPGWVKINVPTQGAMVKAWTHVSQTAMDDILIPGNADYGLVGATEATAHEDGGVVRAGVTVDTSSTAALSTVYWL